MSCNNINAQKFSIKHSMQFSISLCLCNHMNYKMTRTDWKNDQTQDDLWAANIVWKFNFCLENGKS